MKYAHTFWIMAIMWSAILLPSVQAELPPSAYEEMQQKASDVFRINVLQVLKSVTDDPHKTEIRIVADVLKVGRSVAKIRAGELITIRYFVIERPLGWVGPGEVPIPDERAEVPAFLISSPESTDYTPAAGAMTFSTFR